MAAANLCNWVVNIIEYNRIFRNVEPLRATAEAAESLANQKMAELKIVQDKVAEIVSKVNDLKEQLRQAEEKLNFVNGQAEKLKCNLDLASRLVNGLADENVRWKQNVATFKQENLTMIGNALVSAAFVSYIGPFSFKYRTELWKDIWIEDIGKQKIPITEGVDPLFVLSNAAIQA
jgi:dynein heavy chain